MISRSEKLEGVKIKHARTHDPLGFILFPICACESIDNGCHLTLKVAFRYEWLHPMMQPFYLPLKSNVCSKSHLLKKSKSLNSSTKKWTDSVHRKNYNHPTYFYHQLCHKFSAILLLRQESQKK